MGDGNVGALFNPAGEALVGTIMRSLGVLLCAEGGAEGPPDEELVSASRPWPTTA